MTVKLTTAAIEQAIESGRFPNWDWEQAIEMHTLAHEQDERDLLSALRFLEQLHPGAEWTAEQIHGLMYRHFTSRWDSAEVIGALRAREDFADGKISERRLQEATGSKEGAERYLRSSVAHVFEDEDGTVLTFDGLVNGMPHPERI